MRILLVALLVACGSNRAANPAAIAPAPDPRAFAAMDLDAKCAAIAVRTEPCTDALQVADAQAVLGSDTPVAERLAKSEPNTSEEAHTIARVMCVGDRGFADRVVRCWTAATCAELARCAVVSP